MAFSFMIIKHKEIAESCTFSLGSIVAIGEDFSITRSLLGFVGGSEKKKEEIEMGFSAQLSSLFFYLC